jgi:hypothetical protein
MTDTPSPSVHARELHTIDDHAARAFVDAVFGRPDEWRSLLIQYRLSSDFQADWKAEVGHWLKTAERLGFLEKVLARVLKRAKSPPPHVVSAAREANDPHHLVLAQELAPAMATHYFVGTGWAFEAWEPVTGGGVDVDVSLRAPGGTRVMLQVKAPDQPGDVVGHRLVGGEYNERVLIQITKAAGQLPVSTETPNLIVVSANRTWPLSGDPQCVVTELIGSTLQMGNVVMLPRSRRGKFWTPEWRHIAGVVLLDYLRGIDEFKYACTILLNPFAEVGASAEWFPRARVCVLEGSTFRWVRGEPGDAHTLPDGTALADDE